jgi:hypothetical protein
VVEHLPSKCEALSSNPIMAKNFKKKERKKNHGAITLSKFLENS